MDRMDVRLLGPEKKSFHWDEPADSVGLEGEPAFHHPVSIDIKACRIEDRVVVEGTLKSRVVVACSRCLENFESSLEASLAIEYREGQAPAEVVGGPINDDEVDVNWFTPPWLDMGEDFRQVLLLEVPAFPVCREDCKGLCPSCGANLNREPCGHGIKTARAGFQELGEALKKKRRNT